MNLRPFKIEDTPPGVHFDWEDRGFVVRVSTRSPIAFFLIPFTAVWSGLSLTMLYIRPFLAGEGFSFLSIFGLPFLVGSFFLLAFCAMTIAGEIRVAADGFEGEIFTGIGGLGRRQRFNWRDISTVREEISLTRSRPSSGSSRTMRTARVILEGNRRIAFGQMLGEDQRFYLIKALGVLIARLHGYDGTAAADPHIEVEVRADASGGFDGDIGGSGDGGGSSD